MNIQTQNKYVWQQTLTHYSIQYVQTNTEQRLPTDPTNGGIDGNTIQMVYTLL